MKGILSFVDTFSVLNVMLQLDGLWVSNDGYYARLCTLMYYMHNSTYNNNSEVLLGANIHRPDAPYGHCDLFFA